MSRLRWRPPARADLSEWVQLLDAIEEADQRGEAHEVADVEDEWSSVWSNPETDSIFVWDGPELVAFGWLKTQVGQEREHRIDCWGGVRPSHRRRGIGARLLDWQLARASVVAQGLEPALDVRIGLDAADHQRALLQLAASRGFAPRRRFLEVARSTDAPLVAATSIEGLRVVEWTPEHDASARAAHTDSFQDHWGSEPRSEEEWRQWYTGHRCFRPDLSVLVVEEATDEVVALVLCAAYPQDWAAGVTPVEAWINTVGTRRAWRGRGVACWALTASLERIAADPAGFERAILGVDSENPTGALRLYRRLGFEDVRAVTLLARGPLPGDAVARHAGAASS